MKQTAVEWYAIESGKLEVERAKGYLTFPQMFNKMLEILNEAKEMEEQQIKEAYTEGAFEKMRHLDGKDFMMPTEYYKETFKSE